MPRKKKATEPLPAGGKDTKMKSEMRDLNLENEMMDKVLAARKKKLEQLKAMKAEEELLIGSSAPEGDDTEAAPGFEMFDSDTPQGRPFPPRRPYDRSPNGQLDRNSAFEATLAEFTETDGKVEIYRLKDNTYAKIGTYPAKEWGNSLESVAKKFGGGTYKIRLRAPDGTIGGETIVTFDEEAYPKPSQRPVEPAANPMELFKLMQEREEKNQDKFMVMMSTMMSTLANTIGQKSNMISNMNDLAHFKQLFADKDKPAPEPEEKVMKLLEMFQTGMEFGAKNSGGDSEPSIMSMLAKVLTGDGLPRLTEALKVGLQPPPQLPPRPRPQAPRPNPPVALVPPQAQQVLPLPAVSPATPAPAADEDGEEQPSDIPAASPQQEQPMSLASNFVVVTYKPVILGYAQHNADPRQVADMIIERVGRLNEGWLLIMDDFLKVPTTKELWVYGNAPELRAFDSWVDSVMAALAEGITEFFKEEPEEVPAEPAAVQAPAKPVKPKKEKAPKSEPEPTK